MFQHNLMHRVRMTLIVTLIFFGCSATTQAVNTEAFTNFLGMKFLPIPAGSFKMGSASKIDVTDNELPQHTVKITRFEIMTTETTLAQYKRYIIDSNQIEIVTEAFMEANAFDDNAPVVFLSWNDIKIFLHWLNQHKPANDAGKYRLPTEAEWEYACRAGANERYCGSDNTASSVAWFSSNSIAYQQPVAQKNANAFGLYDMSGNVREQVEDCYHQNYEKAPTDGSAWITDCESFSLHVARGGSWDEGLQEARASDRLTVGITTRLPSIGFRVVREVP